MNTRKRPNPLRTLRFVRKCAMCGMEVFHQLVTDQFFHLDGSDASGCLVRLVAGEVRATR